MKTAYCTGAGIWASPLPGAGEVRGSGAAILSPAVHLPPPDPAGSLPPSTPRLTAPECTTQPEAPLSRCGCDPRSPAPGSHSRIPPTLSGRERALATAQGGDCAGAEPRGKAVHAQRLRVNSPGRAPLARRPPRPLLRAPRPYLVAEFEHCHSSVPARAHIQLSAPQMSTPGARGNGRHSPGKRQEPGSRR